MKQGISIDTILRLAARGPFFVDVYGERHASLRRKCRRAEREGKLRLILRNSHYFVYLTAKKENAK